MSFNGIGSGMIKIAEDTPSYGKSMALGAAGTAALVGGVSPLLFPKHTIKAIGLGARAGLGTGAAAKYMLDRRNSNQ